MDNIKKVLLTGAGSPGGPGIIKCLRESGIYVVGGDIDINASGRFLCNDFVEMPLPSQSNFIDFILDYCLKNNIHQIIPLVTKELYVFSKCKNLFSQNNINVLVSDYDSLRILNDKKELSKLCLTIGVPTPEFEIFSNSGGLIEHLRDVDGEVVVKPTYGNGSRGIRIISDSYDKFDLLFNSKPNSIHINKLDYIKIIENKKIPEIMVCEYLPGEEVTVDCIVGSNKTIVLIRERTAMRDGISIAGKFIRDTNIEEYVRSIISHLPGCYGPIGFQFKKDKSGIFRILESNPRLQGTSVAASALGYNYPLNCFNLLSRQDFDKPIKLDGFSFKRFYSEVYFES